MTGGDILGVLLLAEEALTQKVPPASIKLGRLPDGVMLPALLLRQISSVERQALKRVANVKTFDRVAVTVRAKSYREVKQLVGLIIPLVAGRTGDLGGGTGVAILLGGQGPDLNGPNNTFEQTINFRVSFDAQAAGEDHG